jgi:hypothetical protein
VFGGTLCQKHVGEEEIEPSQCLPARFVLPTIQGTLALYLKSMLTQLFSRVNRIKLKVWFAKIAPVFAQNDKLVL